MAGSSWEGGTCTTRRTDAADGCGAPAASGAQPGCGRPLSRRSLVNAPLTVVPACDPGGKMARTRSRIDRAALAKMQRDFDKAAAAGHHCNNLVAVLVTKTQY